MSTRGRSLTPPLEECPCSGATLARLIQPAILTLLARGATHGYRVVQRLAETPLMRASRPDPTGVYRMLRLMEKRGLVVSAWDLSDSGPAKRSYRLTPGGRRCLARWVRTLDAYRRAIDGLLRAARQAAAGADGPARNRRKADPCCSRAKSPSSRARASGRSSAR
ncbi:MAG: PadR family transcriptional regulator [Planctomycetes bacterium]|nr:PadR family transcriptional regulator [Planctomycetota bacterium]